MTFRKTSVIICTRNRSLLLPNLIDQLRVQDYPADAFEIIVVDNASTDNTREVIERLIDEPGVIVRYVPESHAGITFARNRGAEEARYPYLAYIDDDNTVGPTWLFQLVQGFELHEKVVVVAGRVLNVYDDQQIPAWFGPKIGVWLAEYNFPGSQPRLLDNPGYISEGNVAIMRQAWEASGGFLGMDKFGNPHVSSNESIYLLEQIKRIGGKVAFVPSAIVYHHKIIPTQNEIQMRAFWNGVSAGFLEHILHKRTWIKEAYHVLLNAAASFVFFFLALFSLLKFDKPDAAYQLLRAIRRIGLILSELHLVGDWRQIREFVSDQG